MGNLKSSGVSTVEVPKMLAKKVQEDLTKIKKPASIIDKTKIGEALKGSKIPCPYSGTKLEPAQILQTKQGFFSKLKNTKIAQAIGKAGSKIWNGLKSGFGKIGNFFKGKGGKVGLALAAGAALVAGGKYLYDKYNEPTKETQTQPPLAEEDFSPDEQATILEDELICEQDNTRVAKQPILETIPPVKAEETSPVTEPEEATPQLPTEYEVQKGDNVWNIAKKHLKDLNPDPDYKPTNAEILKHTKELIALNELHYEPDNYTVVIKPKDKLKFVA